MRLKSLSLALAVGHVVCSPAPALDIRQSNACFEIADEIEKNPDLREIRPSLALGCLRVFSFDVEESVALIDYLIPMVSFQSTLAFLKDPPEEYKMTSGHDGLDLLGELNKIREKAIAKEYSSQYDFLVAVKSLSLRVKDGHFSINPWRTGLFNLIQDIALMAVSIDGVSLPEMYELEYFQDELSRGREPSPVVKFNGIPIDEYLDNFQDRIFYQDKDASYNSLLVDISAFGAGENIDSGPFITSGLHYDIPDETTVELADGTVITRANVALMTTAFKNQLIKEVEARRGVAKTEAIAPQQDDQPSCAPLEGISSRPSFWPRPVEEHAEHYTGLYFLTGEYEDTAVLEIQSFQSPYTPYWDGDECQDEDLNEFYRFVYDSARIFQSSGGRHLIIDVMGNDGGFDANVFHILMAFFNIDPDYGFNIRMRSTPALRWLANAAQSQQANVSTYFRDLFYRFPENLGPERIHEDDFSKLIFRNITERNRLYGFSNPGLGKPLLPPGDIVVLTNGMCSSACALFVDLITNDLGVRSVVMGGRPIEGTMQAVGGTKGALLVSLQDTQNFIDLAVKAAGLTSPPPELGIPPADYQPGELRRMTTNGRDVWRDGANVPTQFTVQAANCRLFYTPDTVLDVVGIWKRVADVAWRGGKCVPGSTANRDDTISDRRPAFRQGGFRAMAEKKKSGAWMHYFDGKKTNTTLEKSGRVMEELKTWKYAADVFRENGNESWSGTIVF